MTAAERTLPPQRFRHRARPGAVASRSRAVVAAQPWTWPAAVLRAARRPELPLRLVAALVFVIPAQLLVPGLGDAGRPVLVIGWSMAVWWLLCCTHPLLARSGRQPVRWAMALYVGLSLLSFGAGHLRGAHPLVTDVASRHLIIAVAAAGLALAMADGIDERAGLDRVLRTLVGGASFAAAVGIAQALGTPGSATDLWVPGLVWHDVPPGTSVGGLQVTGTFAHSTEFSVTMALATLVAFHYARFADSVRQRVLFSACTLLCAIACSLSTPRIGIVTLGVAVLTMVPMWFQRVRLTAVTIIAALLLGIFALAPGTFSGLRSLLLAGVKAPTFMTLLSDERYLGMPFAQQPWLGDAAGEFVPLLRGTADDFVLVLLMSGGVIGVLFLLGLNLAVFVQGQLARRRTHAGARDRGLVAVLMAAIPATIAATVLVGSVSFSTLAMTWAMAVGAIGAMWRFTRESPARS